MKKKETPKKNTPKKIDQNNHEADIRNANKGTSGTNVTYGKAQGNRSKQLLEARKEK